ncbi:MAG: transposase [Bacteroidales bacterium]|nr:transposase [Bacteroidales bacterium]
MKNGFSHLSRPSNAGFRGRIYLAEPPKDGEVLEFFFVSTDHLSKGVWFRDDQDYKVGMNYIAIIALCSGIKVLAFILMSNHVHLVLQCSRAEAGWFMNELKRRYSEYLNRRYGTDDFLRLIKVDIQKVSLEDESLERAVAYTLMNCVAANICLTAADYPWSSVRAYFTIAAPKGGRVGDLSKSARRKMLHSKAVIPDDTLICEDGYILPEAFIPVKFVESIFRTPKRLNYFLMNSSKAKQRLVREDGLPSFADSVVIAAVADLCRSLFRKVRVDNLNEVEKTELVKQVRRRFSADAHQISRVLSLPYSDVTRMMEAF